MLNYPDLVARRDKLPVSQPKNDPASAAVRKPQAPPPNQRVSRGCSQADDLARDSLFERLDVFVDGRLVPEL